MPHKEAYFRIYRRNLPHFRARGHCYFVTWRIDPRQPPLSAAERTIVAEALKWFDTKRYDLWGFVVMDDHAHVLLIPDDAFPLESILHSWKSYTAHEIQETTGRQGAIWQHESFDRIVRNEQELYEKMEYILNNPAKRWPDQAAYPWVWCKGID